MLTKDAKILHKTHKNAKVDFKLALKMRLFQKMSYEQIGRYFGVGKQVVHQQLAPFLKYLEKPEAIESFQEIEGQLLTAVKMRILNEIQDPERIKKAQWWHLVWAYEKLDKVFRLATGQATENIDLRALNLSLKQIQRQRQELEAEIQEISKQIEQLPEPEIESE